MKQKPRWEYEINLCVRLSSTQHYSPYKVPGALPRYAEIKDSKDNGSYYLRLYLWVILKTPKCIVIGLTPAQKNYCYESYSKIHVFTSFKMQEFINITTHFLVSVREVNCLITSRFLNSQLPEMKNVKGRDSTKNKSTLNTSLKLNNKLFWFVMGFDLSHSSFQHLTWYYPVLRLVSLLKRLFWEAWLAK